MKETVVSSEDGVPVHPTMTDQRRPTDDIAPLVPRLPTDTGSTLGRKVPKADGGLRAPVTDAPLVPDVH
ncbi:hypothetical protein [Halomarina rubra]|uniref:Uncharacterized protein n=1 Tax=Halomarina rubra TaxID=2071873 RepID=A0ABD6AU92_9EURY|nr:hypothetical protein [Halomarina rubra]